MRLEELEFTHVTLASTDNKVAACWLYKGPRDAGRGVYMSSTTFTIATPGHWSYENSLSAHSRFVSNEDVNEKVKFLRREGEMDVYLDLATGKEAYVGRTPGR